MKQQCKCGVNIYLSTCHSCKTAIFERYLVEAPYILDLKCFTKYKPHAGHRNYPHGSDGMVPSAAAWHYLQRARSIPSLPGVMAVRSAFLCVVTLPWRLTFDLDNQTLPREGPNTSSVRIWRKSVQRFPRYLIHNKTKTKSQPALKTEPLAVHRVW